MSLQDKFEIIIPPQDIGERPHCLEAIVNGDPSAFAWLYKNYCKKVYQYALLLTADETISEDLVQDVFLNIWKHRDLVKDTRDFNGYLHTMTRNAVKNYWKHKSIEKKHYAGYKMMQDNVHTSTEKEEVLEAICIEAMEVLPEKQRVVYELRRIHRWRREKIADVLHVSPFTVKAHIQKALKTMKVYVRQKAEEEMFRL